MKKDKLSVKDNKKRKREKRVYIKKIKDRECKEECFNSRLTLPTCSLKEEYKAIVY